ncbi:MAG TPA: potassium transporter TrkG [Legionellaceae bacterium]|nr:potassium transporter TrkG [Legionellaceae bacterium]
MQYKTIFRLIGLLLILFSFSMLPPLVINYIFAEPIWLPFIMPFIIIFSTGSLLWFAFRAHRNNLKIREGFLIVVILWLVISFFASLPFLLFPDTSPTITDAIFETVSGLTTTGAATFTKLNVLPRAMLYYRQQLQFIGGMGIIVLAVAIFPMLGIGGSQLFRVEAAGPKKDNKFTPRIAQTAKVLWMIYCFLTIACAVCYWYCGMDWFYAIGESFATISTGGFSMHDESFFYYNSKAVEIFACIFMLIGSISFSLHFMAFRQHDWRFYWKDEEFRFYIGVLFLLGMITFVTMFFNHFFTSPHHFADTIFVLISLSSTTGFTLLPFDNWPTFVPILIVIMSLFGGCAGSTTGGLKMLRVLLLGKHSKREFLRLLHPQALLSIKMDQQTVAESTIQSVTGYVSLFFALFALLLLIFVALGNDFVTSFSATAAGLANSGAGIGAISNNFNGLNTGSKWILIVAMLIGRLELYPFFILFMRPFWQK